MAAPEHLRKLPDEDDGNMALHFYRDIPLAPGSFEFRILKLLPGAKGDPVVTKIVKTDLGDASKLEPYNTLSYTWGSATPTKPITVNDEVFNATVNLYDALQHVRREDAPVTIWVDAICINQWDLDEKSFQVSFMAEIYKRCDTVYVWLGCAGDAGELQCGPFALFEHFRDEKHCQDLPGFSRDPGTGAWRCDVQDPGFRAIWDSFGYVARSPWWGRAWTVQELILSPVAILICGDFSIHWADIAVSRVRRNRHFYTYTDDCCGYSHEAIPNKEIQPFDVVLGEVEQLESVRLRNGHFHSFQEIERAFASRRCVNPRDEAWSLLSFTTRNASDYPVDYTKPVSDVFFGAFATMLAESGGSMGCFLGHGFNNDDFALPSWVRNYINAPPSAALNYLQNRRGWAIYPLFDACGGREGTARVVGDTELHLQGVRLDRVAAVGRACEDFWTDDMKGLMDNWYDLCQGAGLPFDRDALDQEFSRVLCNQVMDDPADHAIGLWRFVRDGDPDLPSDAQWAGFVNRGDVWGLPRKYRGAVNTAIAGHALYVTTSGRMGFSLPGTQPGDEVWAIDGSKVPFLLRPSPDDSGHRRLVGETYLHGVMRGEGVGEGVDSVRTVLV